MNVALEIPDDLARRIGDQNLGRRALEALAAEEYRLGRLTKPDLRRLFGLETGEQVEGFLKVHGVFEDYSVADLEQDREALRRLGF